MEFGKKQVKRGKQQQQCVPAVLLSSGVVITNDPLEEGGAKYSPKSEITFLSGAGAAGAAGQKPGCLEYKNGTFTVNSDGQFFMVDGPNGYRSKPCQFDGKTLTCPPDVGKGEYTFNLLPQ
jgi:hypothetical protein